MVSEGLAIACIYGACALGFIWAAFNAQSVLEIDPEREAGTREDLKDRNIAGLIDIGKKISIGANAFLTQEYKVMTLFFSFFSIIVFILVDYLAQDANNRSFRLYATIAYIVGAVTSIICGFIGMRIAVRANFRTTFKAISSLADAFNVAFQAGCVMGFAMVCISLAVLLTIYLIYKGLYNPIVIDENAGNVDQNVHSYQQLFDLIAGYGLGGSSMALFGRVGGGIYTKAADVGADLVGKVEENLAEDSPRNPATIADNVGDNVGDIAGMGADLFGSFAEATCAALVLIGGTSDMIGGIDGSTVSIYYPMLISAVGIVCSIISSAIGIYGYRVTEIPKIEKALNLQLWISTVLILGGLWIMSVTFLPSQWTVTSVDTGLPSKTIQWWYCYVSTAFGLVSGLLIGLSTDYYTSNAHYPVQEMAGICTSGAAINVIYGLALGYLSTIVPIILLSLTIIVGTYLLGMLGVALAAIGMLSNLCICLAIDAYGPISDNAGGIAEMCEIGEEVRAKTDALDAAGNTTAAVGKGFAIGSAALVSLALYGAFLTRCASKTGGNAFTNVQVNDGWVFGSMFIGAMLPYWFSALTMKSVGRAANMMVAEVRRQFQDERYDCGLTLESETENSSLTTRDASLCLLKPQSRK